MQRHSPVWKQLLTPDNWEVGSDSSERDPNTVNNQG